MRDSEAEVGGWTPEANLFYTTRPDKGRWGGGRKIKSDHCQVRFYSLKVYLFVTWLGFSFPPFLSVVLLLEPRASCVLGKHSTDELYFFVLPSLLSWVSLSCLNSLWNLSFLAAVFCVVGLASLYPEARYNWHGLPQEVTLLVRILLNLVAKTVQRSGLGVGTHNIWSPVTIGPRRSCKSTVVTQ